MASTPNTTTLSRQSSVVSAEIRTTVKDYIEGLRQQPQSDVILEEIVSGGSSIQSPPPIETADGNQTGGSGVEVTLPVTASHSQIRRRQTQLPPIADLESYILENGTATHAADNFLNILPDLAEAIASYVRGYPEQVKPVWQSLKPILKEIRKRNRLHGRHLQRLEPPICKKIPSSWTNCHGDLIEDNYAWLTNKDDPEVLKYLEDENRYAETMLSHTKTLQKVLFKEFVSRLDENEESVKVQLPDGWNYFSRKIPGAEYRLHCRADKNGMEEVYLDENELARDPTVADSSFFHVGFLRHTPDCVLIAYGIDISGSERYSAYFKNMETKETLKDVIPDCYEDFEFSNDGEYAFYIKIDEYERAYQLKRHKIGTDVSEDVLLYEETDEMFCLTMTKSCNKHYLLLKTSAQVTSETRFIDLENNLDEPRVVFDRREKIQYSVEHHSFADAEPGSQTRRGFFYVLTNEKNKNNQLFRIPVLDKSKKQGAAYSVEELQKYKEIVVDARDFVLIESFQVRAGHLIVFERSNCMQNIRIVNLSEDNGFETFHYVSFSDGVVYSLWPGSVDEEVADLSKSVSFETNTLRFTYTSFTQPKQVIDYNMDTRVKTVVHEGRVLGPGYDRSLYVNKRLWATGIDGTAIPISMVYRRDLLNMANKTEDPTDTTGMSTGQGNPLLLHGYGAYGSCVNPIFSTSRISLLDRGFIYAIAHVRGGSDMGNGWYIEGKLEKKTNTFNDFISCAEFLLKEGYTTTEKLAIYGRSAGGLLIGATVNMRPDLFKAVLTEVPFVDVINTMFDSTIPWTAFEFEEWGNPENKRIYDAMLNYCPYTNIKPGQVFPNMLIVGGMNDPRVAYFEPAKWTAKLRELGKWSATRKTDIPEQQEKSDGASILTTDPRLQDGDRLLLLKIQDAGHSGSGGQYSNLEDLAFEYAYLISVLGAQFKPVSSGGMGLSLNGVDYQQYWEELENDNNEEEEEFDGENGEEAEIRKPSTPLQKFSDFWKRRGSKASKDKKGPKKEKKPKRMHSRSGSLLGSGLGLILGRGKLSAEIPEESTVEPEVEKIAGEEADEDIEKSNSGEMSPTEAEEVADDVGEPLPAPKPLGPSHSASTIGSKASLRYQAYPPEEASGRVQSTGKAYNFWNKFFV